MGLMTPCWMYFGMFVDKDSVIWKQGDREF